MTGRLNPMTRLFIVYSLLFLFGCGFYAAHNFRQASRDANAELRALLNQYAQTINDSLVRHRATLSLLGELARSAGGDSDPAAGGQLSALLAQADPGMAGFTLADRGGNAITVDNSSALTESWRIDRDAVLGTIWARLRDGAAVVVGRPHQQLVPGQWMIPMAVAIRDIDGEMAMVSGASFRTQTDASPWRATGMPTGFATATIDTDGYLISGTLFADLAGDSRDLDAYYQSPVAAPLLTAIDAAARSYGIDQLAWSPTAGPAVFAWQYLEPYGVVAVAGIEPRALRHRLLASLLGPASFFVLYLLGSLFVFRHFSGVQRQVDERLAHLAHHDTLTGLPNRSLGIDRLSMALATSLRERKGVGVLFVDLDNFKTINDTHGHALGDALIRQLADIFTGALRKSDTVARLGGDEFLIILPQLANMENVEMVAARVVSRLLQPIKLESHLLYTTASVGVAVSPKDSTDPDELMRFADIALYHAKGLGKHRYSFYNDEMNARAQRRGVIETRLRHALETCSTFSLCYQPQVDVMSLQCRGVEALVRWDDPELGRVSPVEFIPVAEEVGLIGPLTRFVFATAMRDIKALCAELDSTLSLSVNVSTHQFRETSVMDLVRDAVAEHDFPARQLVVELTESGLVENFEEAREQLAALRAMEVGIAIDDFGTGYSSLAYLNRLPLSELKIDRSFVANLCNNDEDLGLVRSIVHLGRGRRLDVVAEGVEDKDQFLLLMSMDCTTVQGYLYAPPLVLDELRDWLRARSNTPPGVQGA